MEPTTTSAVRAADLQLRDVPADLLLMLDGSTVDVDGITADVEPHPAFDPAGAAPGAAAWLVRFTDRAGRARVAEIELTATWRETTCWHLELKPSAAGGQECRDCGIPTSPDPRCPDCRVVVTDLETYFGVHTASCGHWDERCTRCHRPFAGPGTAPADVDDPRLCVTCAAHPAPSEPGAES